LNLKGPHGQRTVPVEQFFVLPAKDIQRENVLEPGELIVEVRVPTGRRSSYVKLMQKQSFDWPMAEAAVALDLDGSRIREARVAVGAVAPAPRRAAAVEKALSGANVGAIDEAAKLATEGARPLDKNHHKVPALQVAVLRSLRAAAGIES
jgi:xanthine dehydrogenase YagS FAD-binding subunit